MAFNKWGYLTITAGETIRVKYVFGGHSDFHSGGDDHGAQFAMADPEAAPGILWVTEQGKERASYPRPGIGTSGYIYWVSVRYELDRSTSMPFTLQGGGFV